MVQTSAKTLRRFCESRVDFLQGAPTQTRVTLLAAASCSSSPQPSLLRSSASRPMRIVFSGDAGLHLCKYYFCAPSPLPPVHICKGRRGQVSSDDQQASAGRGRRLSELCSRPPSPFLGSTQAGAPGRPAGSGVAACQTCPLRQARTIALLLPAGGGGCYNIHIPPRHRHFSYCDL